MNSLDYYKSEIIKILKKQAEVGSKSFAKSVELIDCLYLQKANMPVGHVSTYKDGSMWKKIQSNPPKWKCIRQGKNFSSETSGARQSITKLINKVRDCKNTDELLDIVMFNIDRFRDEKGQVLPIVEKLKAEVDTRKNLFNIGKPSVNQKIDEFNARREYAKSKFEIGENISDKELKDILSSVKHTPERDKYINDYYLSRLSNYEEKELTDSDGYSGKISVYKGRKENQDETDAALFFKKKGCDVVMLSESTEKQGEKHPDFLVNGVLVEVKTCKNGGANGIASEIQNAINKRNTEVVSVFLFDKSAKENYDTIAEKLNLKKPYLNSEVKAIMLVNNDIVTLVDKKNTVGEQEVPPSADKNIPQSADFVKQNIREKAIRDLTQEDIKNMSDDDLSYFFDRFLGEYEYKFTLSESDLKKHDEAGRLISDEFFSRSRRKEQERKEREELEAKAKKDAEITDRAKSIIREFNGDYQKAFDSVLKEIDDKNTKRQELLDKAEAYAPDSYGRNSSTRAAVYHEAKRRAKEINAEKSGLIAIRNKIKELQKQKRAVKKSIRIVVKKSFYDEFFNERRNFVWSR